MVRVLGISGQDIWWWDKTRVIFKLHNTCPLCFARNEYRIVTPTSAVLKWPVKDHIWLPGKLVSKQIKVRRHWTDSPLHPFYASQQRIFKFWCNWHNSHKVQRPGINPSLSCVTTLIFGTDTQTSWAISTAPASLWWARTRAYLRSAMRCDF